jgi:hypothetical protein
MRSRAVCGCSESVADQPLAFLTSAVVTPGNALAAVVQIWSSPVTTATGTPYDAA